MSQSPVIAAVLALFLTLAPAGGEAEPGSQNSSRQGHPRRWSSFEPPGTIPDASNEPVQRRPDRGTESTPPPLIPSSPAISPEKSEAPGQPAGQQPAQIPGRVCDRLGNGVDIGQFRDRSVLYAYFAFWCDTWKPLLSDLKKLQQKNPQLTIILIAVDSRERQAAEPDMLRAQLPFLLLVDLDQALTRKNQVTTVPTLLLQENGGRIRFRHQGFPGQQVLQRELALLETPSTSAPPWDPKMVGELLIPEERLFLRQINSERQKRGLPPLLLQPRLVDLSRERLQRNLERGQLSHETPLTPDQAASQQGLVFSRIAENLANANSAGQAVQAMLASPSHKANLLNPNYRHIGVSAFRVGPSGFVYGVLFVTP